MIIKVASEDAQTISTLLSFRSIRIDNSEAERFLRSGILMDQNSVRTDAEISVTDPLSDRRGQGRLTL
jgi:hypothetical protein